MVGLKNTQYQRAAINRARFLLSGDEDVRGQLKEILLGINEVMNEQEMNLGGIYRMEFLDDLVRIYSSSVMDGNFLYSQTEGCREFAPQDLVTKELDFFKRQEKIRRITEKMENILSPAKIERYVERQLGEKKQLHAAEIPLDTEEDFIKIIYIRLYDQRKNINYKVKSLEEVHIWWQKYF